MYSSKTSGFTLLEMLIAIAIFAMLGLAANAVLQTVLRDDEVTQDFAKQLKGLQQGFSTIERDLSQIVARTGRTEQGGRTSTVIQSGKDMLESESEALVFYRLGWLNPGGILPRGTVQYVAYVVQNGQLQRWYYPYPDPEVGAEPIKTVLMDKVLSVKYAFFDQKKWQQGGSYTQLPQAIGIEVELEDRGIISRKFLLPDGASDTSAESEADDNKNNNDDDNSDADNGDAAEQPDNNEGDR
ncbi:type II secretion system minor pseudopilin GspJ [Shewanella sp. C32]|uniref:Type II secretion system protein J n=1 Tax=Shewanella electrica TaxID=515560 RepID=A0ABT2FMA1_9GAMM|nr:type II secretion system minor pseudopilin GspJ [Shewanella electrica]MCH1925922.1 type II secretion system minor pseudopilin GspJ [Shewanella electrica]MCS4557472.1 type II secretion system minor pseudopilin GspJ [Shewanella electrica]